MRDLKADLGIARGMKPLNTSEYYEGISLETAQQYMMAAEGWPYAIERAIEAEKRVEELENQVDILSTTLNMYCSPYYDMRERAEKAEALARELVEAMNGLLYEYEDLILRLPCSTPVRGQPIHYNSQAAKQAENLLIKAKEVLGDG